MTITFDKPLNLNAWMAIRKITNEEFAEAVGVKVQTVSGWKSGRSMPNTKYIKKIEQVLDTDFNTIDFSSSKG